MPIKPSRALAPMVLLAWVSSAEDARACGGCFGPAIATESPSLVTGHRMAYAVSPERTVLWDQFEYTGSPEDFAWVLPVRPGAYVEESNDAWFETLEAMTQTRVSSPPLQCASSDASGCGCVTSASEAAALGNGSFDDDSVQVIHRGTVGPYATETLRSTDGDALSAWLQSHGYNIPADIAPVIASYVSEGADFLALRLQPGFGVQQMTPVRVVTPGGDPILPLRMVAAGTGLRVAVVLYAIGEERLGLPDLHATEVRPDRVTWDFSDNTSDYTELREQALRSFLGFAYLTSFADRGFFAKRYVSPNGLNLGSFVGNAFRDNFADLYFAQAEVNDGILNPSCASVRELLESDRLVRETAGSGEIAAAALACGKYSDLGAAMIGMHPARVWTARLEMDLPREALAMDCVVSKAAAQSAVSQQIQATRSTNRPDFCAEPVFESRFARSRTVPPSTWLLAWLFAVVIRLKRRATRHRESSSPS